MANLSNINNKFIVDDGGNVLVGSTANLSTYTGISLYGANPSLAIKTSSGSGWIWTQYVNSSGTNNFSMGVNQSIPFWGVGAGAGMGGGTMDLVVASSGNVGVGTYSPGSKLTVSGPSNAASNTPSQAIVDIVGSSTAHLLMGTASASPYGAWINTDATGQPLILQGPGGNVGIGVTPSAIWSSSYNALQIGLGGSVYAHSSAGSSLNLGANIVYEGTAPNYYDKYLTSSTATKYQQDAGVHIWSTAVSGTAGNAVSWSERMRITNGGQVQVGYYNTARGGANTTFMTGKSGTTYLELNGGDVNGEGGILFADGAGGIYGLINYSHVSDIMQFYTASGERMRIVSTGAVGIDNSSPDSFSGGGSTAASLVIGKGTSGVSPHITLWQGNSAQAAISFASANSGAGQYEGRIRYTRDTGVMDFRTNGIANVLVLNASGNVGIGTTSPSSRLTVASPAAYSGSTFRLETLTSPASYYLEFVPADEGASGITWAINQKTGNIYNNTLKFVQGKVGIGTSSPYSKLDVAAPGTKTNLGTVSNQTITCSSGGGVGEYNQIGFGYTAGDWSPAVIGYVTTNGAGSTLGALIFAARNSTTAMAPTERMRITSDGKVGIGTTSPGNQLQVSTGIGIGTTIGRNYLNGTLANGANIVLNANSSGGNNSAGFIAVSCVPNFASTGGAVGLWTGLHTQSANIYTLISQRNENGITIAESGGQFTVTNNSGSTAYYQLKVLNITDFASTVYGI